MTNLFNLVENLFNTDLISNVDSNVEKLDLSKKEDVDKVNKLCDEVLSNKFLSGITELFGIGPEDIKKTVNKIYEASHKDESNEDVKEEPTKPVIKPAKPSSKVDSQTGVKIHHLVGEYIDNMVRPQAKEAGVDDNVINDAYAGLYEFACWLYTK